MYWSYRNQRLRCAPSLRRPDFTWVFSVHLAVLEVDENCHTHYTRHVRDQAHTRGPRARAGRGTP
eukprot:40359-Eustigmatos_ZCMA.PRE.1